MSGTGRIKDFRGLEDEKRTRMRWFAHVCRRDEKDAEDEAARKGAEKNPVRMFMHAVREDVLETEGIGRRWPAVANPNGEKLKEEK